MIACVDDDAPVREAVEGLLNAFGYNVITFSSAEDFLESDEIGLIACLITDIRLGGKSGLQLQRELLASGHEIPTIIITAFAEAGYRGPAIEAGAVDFLRKPILPERLLAAVERAVGLADHESQTGVPSAKLNLEE